jgi:arylsulfatase A-like enzyme
MKPSRSMGLLLGGTMALSAFSTGRSADDSLPLTDAESQGKISPRQDLVPYWPQTAKAPDGAPNVVLILLDDVAFGDTSLMGGSAQTPVIEKLAAEGLLYNRFHVCPMSSPTRASLLTGRNPHQVGFGNISELAAGFPGYTSVLPKEAAPMAEVLRQNGYSTAAFGKWHNTAVWEIGPTGPFDRWPTGQGFEYFYGFMGGATSQWHPRLYRNTVAVEPPATPQQGYHLTTDLANEAIRWLHHHEATAAYKPFFLYFSTGAVHAPHHVAKEWIDKYRGKFNQGWDKLREETFARQKKLGVIPADSKLTPRPSELPAWDSLSAKHKKLMARQAEVYAAFLEQTDYEVGRVLQAVKDEGKSENTLFLYIVGDNGASGEGAPDGYEFGGPYGFSRLVDVETRLKYAGELGSELFENAYSAAWAWGMSSPFQWMKQVASHFGGTRDPLIVSWPARIKARGEIRSQFAHVVDIAPTIYELAGIRFPETVNGVQQIPLEGSSIAYTFDNPDAPSVRTLQYFELMGSRGIYKDGWWAGVRNRLPWNLTHLSFKFPWELYDLTKDFSQSQNLAAEYPEKLKEMQDAFDSEAHRNQVYPLAPAWGLFRPSPLSGKNSITYYSGVSRLTGAVAPDLNRRLRKIIAVLNLPTARTEGVIIANGGRWNGFSMYVKDRRLVCESDGFGPGHQKLASPEALPVGKVEVAFEVETWNSALQNPVFGTPGDTGRLGRLFINGMQVGEARFRSFGSVGSETLDIGSDTGTPVSDAYSVPFAFTGQIEKVTLELQ